MAKKKREGAGMFAYLKEAFLWRWNLLVLGGAAAAAVISGQPEIALPLIGAAELAYLAGLVSIPRFRAAIDAREHAREKAPLLARPATAAESGESLKAMLSGLEKNSRERFERLRNRCREMQSIAQGVRGSHRGNAEARELRTPALDRLLWVFLRLLFSRQALTRFLDTTDREAIEKELDSLRTRREAVANDDRLLRSIDDAVATGELRLDNYARAERNAEFVELELDRIEGKIQALTEMAVNHQDPDYISSQVDSVAASMQQTEAAISELHHITGLTDQMESPPAILDAELETVTQ